MLSFISLFMYASTIRRTACQHSGNTVARFQMSPKCVVWSYLIQSLFVICLSVTSQWPVIIDGLTPSYLSRDLQRVSDLVARRRLRSSSTSTLVVPPTRFPHGCGAGMEQLANISHIVIFAGVLQESVEDETVCPKLS